MTLVTRAPRRAGRRDPEPAAAAARPARAGRRRALRGASAPPVHRQPAPQGPGRRRLGGGARRRLQPALLHGARPRARGPAALAGGAGSAGRTARAAAQDAERLRSVLAERRSRSQEFFTASAAQWDALRAELFGQRADLLALPGLLDEEWTRGRPRLRHRPARRRPSRRSCGGSSRWTSRAPCWRRRGPGSATTTTSSSASGDLEQLPIEDRELDAAVLLLVLHYVAEPARALAEARRALKPGGRLLVMDMTPHAARRIPPDDGARLAGLRARSDRRLGSEAGLERVRYRSLPPEPQAKGPGLFAATMRRPPATRTRG